MAEKNYDVGNCELLVVVAALQEWGHWLEGSEVPLLLHQPQESPVSSVSKKTQLLSGQVGIIFGSILLLFVLPPQGPVTLSRTHCH